MGFWINARNHPTSANSDRPCEAVECHLRDGLDELTRQPFWIILVGLMVKGAQALVALPSQWGFKNFRTGSTPLVAMLFHGVTSGSPDQFPIAPVSRRTSVAKVSSLACLGGPSTGS